MLTFLLFCVFSHVSLATGVVYDFQFVGYSGKQDCSSTITWQMPLPWPQGTCMYDWVLLQWVQFNCGSNGLDQFEETCYSDATCQTQKDCLGDGSMAPVIYTNGGCMMDFVNSAAHGNKAGINPYTVSWTPGTCGSTPTVNERALADSNKYESKAESQVGQTGVVWMFHVTVYSGKQDCNGATTLQMGYPYPQGACVFDASLSNYILFTCGSNDQIVENCFSDKNCQNQIDCLQDGSMTVTYSNDVCQMDFVNSAAHGNKAGIVPFKMAWTPGICGTPTVNEQALADSHQYEYLSANAQAYSSQEVVYYGLATIGLFSLIRGFYGAFRPSYKTIPSEEAQV